MTILNSIILGTIQGITEFLPISSTGHLILARKLLNIGDENGLLFDAILQLATSFAVLIYFRKDFFNIVKSLYGSIFNRHNDYSYILAIFWGTLPAVILGLLLERLMSSTFRNIYVLFYTLIIGSLLFFFAEKYARQNQILNAKKGFIIGIFQSLALLPGMSRSGSTISGGLLMGLHREEAIRFSFILSFPIIFGSGFYKLIEFVGNDTLKSLQVPIIWGSIFSFVFGLLAIHYLLKILRKHTLNVFGIYRIFLALVILIILL